METSTTADTLSRLIPMTPLRLTTALEEAARQAETFDLWHIAWTGLILVAAIFLWVCLEEWWRGGKPPGGVA